VQPDRAVAASDLAVHWMAVTIALHAARLEGERIHAEVVRRRNVFAHDDGNNAGYRGHVEIIGTGDEFRPCRES
jgi:hypothetical protein